MFPRITVDPAILRGRPCIRGMRISVALVVNLVANGVSNEEIVREYPELTNEDIQESLLFAAVLAQDEFHPFVSPAA